MTRYAVLTPVFGVRTPILDDGSGPTEYGRDYIEVEAPNKTKAKAEAVRQWKNGRWDNYINYALGSDENPFTGLEVWELTEDDAEDDPVTLPEFDASTRTKQEGF